MPVKSFCVPAAGLSTSLGSFVRSQWVYRFACNRQVHSKSTITCVTFVVIQYRTHDTISCDYVVPLGLVYCRRLQGSTGNACYTLCTDCTAGPSRHTDNTGDVGTVCTDVSFAYCCTSDTTLKAVQEVLATLCTDVLLLYCLHCRPPEGSTGPKGRGGCPETAAAAAGGWAVRAQRVSTCPRPVVLPKVSVRLYNMPLFSGHVTKSD
jgi:hypothetical protein